MGKAIACTTDQTILGEGPRWDARRGELLWVDILAGCVYRHRIGGNGDLVLVDRYEVGETVGAVAPVEGDDGWLLAGERRFLHLSPDGTVRPLTGSVASLGTRLNDAACDPQGRFWAGTKADEPGGAALYRFDGDGRTEMVRDGMTISNGLDWSPDGATMYLADSGTRTIHARGARMRGSAEIVLLLYRVERHSQRGDLAVDAPLVWRQRDQAAVTVVDQADRRRKTQFKRPLRDRQCVLGAAHVATEHRVDVDAEGGVPRQHLQLRVEHLQALLRRVVRRHVVDADLQMIQPGGVKVLDTLLVEEVAVRDKSGQRAGAADVPDERVEVGGSSGSPPLSSMFAVRSRARWSMRSRMVASATGGECLSYSLQ